MYGCTPCRVGVDPAQFLGFMPSLDWINKGLGGEPAIPPPRKITTAAVDNFNSTGSTYAVTVQVDTSLSYTVPGLTNPKARLFKVSMTNMPASLCVGQQLDAAAPTTGNATFVPNSGTGYYHAVTYGGDTYHIITLDNRF
jgi:hypothetical protein